MTLPLISCLSGTTQSIRTFRGGETLNVPAMVADGALLRVKGAGMPLLRHPSQYGDLIVNVRHQK